MILLAFISGLLASRWIETLLLRVALKVIKDPKTNTQIRKYAQEHDLSPATKGKVISMKGLHATKVFEKGGTLEEMLDQTEHGRDLQEE